MLCPPFGQGHTRRPLGLIMCLASLDTLPLVTDMVVNTGRGDSDHHPIELTLMVPVAAGCACCCICWHTLVSGAVAVG